MSGTLHVVATPIGNLEDITLRAVRVLREVSLIAAEDTRRTARLLAHYSIPTPTTSFHRHNAHARLRQLLEKLRSGESLALVTDAGTPGVSDPGMELVAECIAADIAVEPVPGVSAPLAAVVASGFALDRMLILGFAPSRSKDRNEFISSLNSETGVSVFFEAPHRVRHTLKVMAELLVNRPIMVARELTKVHQEFIRGTSAGVLEQLSEPRGEFTIVVGPLPPPVTTPRMPSDAVVVDEFMSFAKQSASGRRAAVAAVARKYGRSTRDVYAVIERAKKSGDRP